MSSRTSINISSSTLSFTRLSVSINSESSVATLTTLSNYKRQIPFWKLTWIQPINLSSFFSHSRLKIQPKSRGTCGSRRGRVKPTLVLTWWARSWMILFLSPYTFSSPENQWLGNLNPVAGKGVPRSQPKQRTIKYQLQWLNKFSSFSERHCTSNPQFKLEDLF